MSTPFFSVVIPTYRRPALLQQALASVLAQSFRDFEVVISDDDHDGTLSAEVLTAGLDAGIPVRLVHNPVDRGQAGNTNNGIRHATGRWIKLLHDDDILYPTCLERIHAVLQQVGEERPVAVVSCRSDTLSPTGVVLRRWAPRNGQPPAELVSSRYTVYAMYLQEDVGESLPSSLCISRDRIVSGNALMPAREGFVSVVDTHWAIRLASVGDRLIINEALVGKRQEPESITGRITDKQLDAEFQAIRELQFQVIPSDLRPPPLHVAKQALWLRRAAHRLLKRRQPVSAALLALRAWDPRAWLLAARPALARRLPMTFRQTPRMPVTPS